MLEVLYQMKSSIQSAKAAVSVYCVVGIESILNHCRSIFLRGSLCLIQDHLFHILC